MDATRSDLEFLAEVLRVAIAAGATTINMPDTVGYTLPEEFAGLIDALYEHGARAGGRGALGALPQRPGPGGGQLPGRRASRRHPGGVAVNGIGERAGNAALEEIVMALVTRRDLLRAPAATS